MNFVKESLNLVQDVLNYKLPGCKRITSNPQFGVKGLGRAGVTGFLLGLGAGVHGTALVALSLCGTDILWTRGFILWTEYFFLLAVFHFLEFFVTATSQPSKLSSDSFVVNHSKAYTIAAIASWAEFWIELFFLGEYKLRFVWVSRIGLCCVLVGQVVRSLAMWQCGENFSHIIAHDKREDHELVTSGVYHYLRHPSYFGWFYWSIGTQILLCNPLCIIAYAYASYSFFKERIQYEEALLLRFFKEEYVDYMKKTAIGIPFIPDRAKEL